MKLPRLENEQQVLWTREKIALVEDMILRTGASNHPARDFSIRTLRRRIDKLRAEIDEFNDFHAAGSRKQAV